LTNSPALHGITAANGKFVAVGESGAVWVGDGTNWNDRRVTVQNNNQGFNAVAYGNSVYIAAGNAIALSTNSWDWEFHPCPFSNSISKMIFGDGLFVATAAGGSAGRIVTSTNGLDWSVAYEGVNRLGNVAHGNGAFLAWCGTLLWSTNGLNWQPCNAALIDSAMTGWYVDPPAIGFFRDKFIVAGPYGRIFQSGSTSIRESRPWLGAPGFQFQFQPAAQDTFRVQASTDLIAWETIAGGVGDGQTNLFSDPSATTTPKRFFRVVSP
jgi:hypothetical protein